MHLPRWSRHGLVVALLGLFTSVLFQVPFAPSAQATSTILCKGFAACEKAGYSSFGYGPSNYKKMWWRMYSGHNCTNYMAYRMIKAGLPTERPWSGSGDARNWGVVFKSKVNQTPMVGSVAWWRSNHVAYVQQIVDANTIIISEDHYRGDFNWRKITRAGGGWPTGFIHLADEAVTATAPPVVVGTPKVDEALTLKPGTWNRPGAAYKYQWLSAGKAIAGATGTTYTPTAAQVGDTFSVKVTATKAGFKPGTKTSAVSRATLPGTMQVEGVPVISGLAKVGSVLTATIPTVTPEPEKQTYAWFADGKFIPGGSGTSITLKPEQLGSVIRFVASGTRPGYADLRTASVPTAEVLPEKLTVKQEPVLSGAAHVGKPLTVKGGQVTPSATTRYQWLVGGTPIPGATGATYTPSAADAGRRLSVKVSYSRPGYTTIERELRAARLVRSVSWIYVTSSARKTVNVQVVAEGITAPRGTVTLVARDGTKHTLTLKDGRASFKLAWIYSGKRTYTVEYSGSSKVEARSRTVTIQVK